MMGEKVFPVPKEGEVIYKELDVSDLPTSIDWRDKGALNDAKYQGHCGSCWTFSTACTLETHHFIKTGELLSLSEQ